MPRPPNLPNAKQQRTVPRPVRGPRSRYITIDSVPTGGVQYGLKPAGYGLIERMSAGGRNLASISAALGISGEAFRGLRRRDSEAQEALDRGRAALGDELTDILLEHARGGVTVAAIFLAKARCGWREGEAMPGATVNNTQINIQIPERMSDDEFRSIIDGTFHERQQPALLAGPKGKAVR